VLVEGVMGLFDGVGPSSEGSSAAVAALLDLPVILVVEASRQAGSVAALVRGFRDHGPPQVPLAGVVLNRVGSPRHRALLSEALASLEVPLLGVLPPHDSLDLPSRHLGLHPPHELPDLAQRQQQWAALASEHLDLERLWPLLAPPRRAVLGDQDPIAWCLQQLGAKAPIGLEERHGHLPIAVARDRAFHFLYPEAEELLAAVGLEPIPWSPLADAPLPPDCRAVVLPGGYPELHAAHLAANRRSLDQLARAAAAGLPVVAECGGLLLLGQTLADSQGRPHRMAGVLPFHAARGALSLGYRQAQALGDGLLVRRGERWRGHEFHRWQLQPLQNAPPPPGSVGANPSPLWQLEGWGTSRQHEGWTSRTLHASWLHLHWAGCPAIPSRLAAATANAGPPSTNAASSSPATIGPAPSPNAGA
jgi:cobyrinic acid a,c-diamide synthase